MPGERAAPAPRAVAAGVCRRRPRVAATGSPGLTTDRVGRPGDPAVTRPIEERAERHGSPTARPAGTGPRGGRLGRVLGPADVVLDDPQQLRGAGRTADRNR